MTYKMFFIKSLASEMVGIGIIMVNTSISMVKSNGHFTQSNVFKGKLSFSG